MRLLEGAGLAQLTAGWVTGYLFHCRAVLQGKYDPPSTDDRV